MRAQRLPISSEDTLARSEQVLASIRANPALVALQAYNVRGLRDEHLRLIAEALPGLRGQLRTIDLRHNGEITDDGVRALLVPLRGSAVTSVRLGHCAGISAAAHAEIRDAVLPNVLAPARANDKSLRTLSLCGVELRDEQVDVVVEAFEGNAYTATLDLRSNPALTDAGALRLLPLPDTSALTGLSLAGCDGVSAGAKDKVAAAFAAKRLRAALATDLAGMVALRAMDLRDEHLTAVVASVLTSTAVRKLDLAHNPKLTDEGARVLVPALASATWLQEIDLRGCDGISAAAAAEVQEACLSNRLPVLLEPVSSGSRSPVPGPQCLDLLGLGLRDKHVAALVDALAGNAQLQKIDLRHNRDLTDAGLRQLVSTLSKCRVREVVLDGCDAVSESARLEMRDACLPNLLSAALAPVRVNDKALTTLRLSLMDLWDEALGLVAEALMGNEHVTRLQLAGNTDLTDVGVELLLPSIPASRVAEIDLSGCPAVSRMAKDIVSGACLPNLLAPVAENDPATCFLNLFKCGLTDDHMDLLASALMHTQASSRPTTRDSETRPETSSSELSSTSTSAWLRRPGNVHVLKVDLRFNTRLTDAGVRQLIPAIGASRVQEVDMFGCPTISATVRAEVCQACMKNVLAPVHANDPSTTSLKLRSVGLRDKDMEQVSRALSGNEYVTKVNISGNGELTAVGMRQLAEVLQKTMVDDVDMAGCFGVSETLRAEVCKACELDHASRSA
eukprot:COSAG02_NODE_354_length_24016_cov_208.299231_15_plen_733_part_00